ncbi:hypothetical protein AVEN_222348-1 [Araneus ventricosus]|uniref:Uncharacterized protein n=1 Tax=Araneus ventricosus TaxID=182803 RepID=A0A4Y2UKN7_ARAVE|nr:hypothetical protein AVEN_222348-1 [Araneus ventricosus]
MSSREETHPETQQQRKQQVADKLTFSFRRYGTTVLPENVLPLNAGRYNCCTRHKARAVRDLSSQVRLCSQDRCVCGAKGDPNHYATVCPVTKYFHFTKPRAENLSTWFENIVQGRRSLARLMNILPGRRHDIIMD